MATYDRLVQYQRRVSDPAQVLCSNTLSKQEIFAVLAMLVPIPWHGSIL